VTRAPLTGGTRHTARAADPAPPATLETLDTGDAQVAAILRRVAKLRGRDIPILVLGKTGTGKEWLARAIHHDSPRRAAPFIALNCASLPETLIEAELFGYAAASARSCRPTAARCSSMKSAICRSPSRCV
jgi:transcriptional regulator with PAS, ATPase and Fis domain